MAVLNLEDDIEVIADDEPSCPPRQTSDRMRRWPASAWYRQLTAAARAQEGRCAVGRSILVIVWHLLNDPAARCRDLGPDWHARHTDRNGKARSARRRLEALGYDVIITLREDAA